MKTTFKLLVNSTLALLFVLLTTYANAQNRPMKAPHPMNKQQMSMNRKGNHNINESMMKAQKVLKRTQFVILKAKMAVNKGQNYTGDLARAVAHQKQAKKFYIMKNPTRAILHSRQARMYAFKALQANKAGADVDQSYQFNKEENAMIGTQQDGIDLDKDLEQTTFDDKAVTNKEMTDNEVLETPESQYKNE